MPLNPSPPITHPVAPAPGRRRVKPNEPSGAQAHRFKQALKEARTGLIEAQYQVGLMLATGAGTRRNQSEALAWMTRAAERGHAGAQYMLGCHFAPEPGTAPRGQLDEARALDWFYQASRQGHARSHQRLAHLIRQAGPALSAHHEAAAASLGLAESQLMLAKDQLRADADADLRSSGRAWLRRAADQGLAAAQTEWGLACLDQPEFGATAEEGLHWLQAAAAQAWPPALLELHRRGIQPPELQQPIQDPVDAAARHALGELHALGAAGLPVNPQQAQHWFLLAANQGWPAAQAALGRLAESRDPQSALAHYRSAAWAGDLEAQYRLSGLLRAADRSPTEQLQGHHWLVAAAQAGHAQALLAWSELLQQHDPELARAAVLRAAQAGLPEAEYRLALQLMKAAGSGAASDARNWLEQAAAQHHLAARSRLGLLLCSGEQDVRERARGLTLLQSAADEGDPAANWNLALMYAAGTNGLQRDATAALERCRLAADTGFAPAMATMGLLCASLQRAEDAAHWWRQAAQADDTEAQFNLSRALLAGRGVPRDLTQAVEWMQRAAEAGLAQAQTELGVLYATGRGVAIDPIEAHKWFVLARLGGSKTALHNLDQSRKRLSPEQIEEGERRARNWRFMRKRPERSRPNSPDFPAYTEASVRDELHGRSLQSPLRLSKTIQEPREASAADRAASSRHLYGGPSLSTATA